MPSRRRVSRAVIVSVVIFAAACAHRREPRPTATSEPAEPGPEHRPWAAAADIPGTVAKVEKPPSDAECARLNVVFSGTETSLDEDAQQRLDRIAQCIEKEPGYHVRLLDATEAVRDVTALRELREQRARSIAAYLQDRGVERQEIDVVAPGTSGAFTEDVPHETEPPTPGP